MQLTVYNGSGRGKRSNSTILIDAFLKGFSSIEGCAYEMHVLMQKGQMEAHTSAFAEAENVLMVFPMYTDMVPGIVKAFIETLAPFCGREDNPSIGFIIHCGFPEGVQLRALERYLTKLSQRLGSRLTGIVRMGNSEGLRSTAPEKLEELLRLYETLGSSYAKSGVLDQEIITSLARMERLPGWMAFLFRILALTPLVNMGWNKDLKKNNAYHRRFARPYTED